MADSLREKILANVETTLETITVVGGYNHDITTKQVTREKKPTRKIPTDALPHFLIWGITDEPTQHGQLDIAHFRVQIKGITPHGYDDEGASKKIEKLLEDCKKVLMVDPTRGQENVYSRIGTIEFPEQWMKNTAQFTLSLNCVFAESRANA